MNNSKKKEYKQHKYQTNSLNIYPKISKLIGLTLLALFLSNCGDQKKSSCNQLTRKISSLEETVTNNLRTKDLTKIAETAQEFENTSEKITKHNFTDIELNNYAQNLGNIYQEYANTTQNFIVAFNVKDQDKGILYQQKLSELFVKQQILVREINQYCQ